MRPIKLLHGLFQKELPFVHKKRLSSLQATCEALLTGETLSLTELGRNLTSQAKEGSNIERVNRLLGNKHLHSEVNEFYKFMSKQFLGHEGIPVIQVDWSCISSTTNFYILRASLSMKGRSITLYQEAHPKKNENNHETHMSFLDNLKRVLPASSTPIIVTDAGFRGPWFKYIDQLGWYFVGRLRNKNLVDIGCNDGWVLSSTLYAGATSTPTYLGQGWLTKKKATNCHFIRYKGSSRGRVAKNKYNNVSRCGDSKKYAKCHKEALLLVSSLPASSQLAQQTVRIYKQRMQIEETFRDTKSVRFGFALGQSGTQSAKRLSVLLLVDAICTFACWLSGLLTKEEGKAKDFQAHSASFKSILSIVFLGKRAIKKRIKMTKRQFYSAMRNLITLASSAMELAC